MLLNTNLGSLELTVPSKITRVFGDKHPPSLALNHGHFCSSRNLTGLIFYKLGGISPIIQSFLKEYRSQDSEREKYSIREVCINFFFIQSIPSN